MVAAAFGEAEAVRALIAGGADVYAQMGADWTALKWAAYGGHVETVRVLIASGADVNAKGGSWPHRLDRRQTERTHGSRAYSPRGRRQGMSV